MIPSRHPIGLLLKTMELSATASMIQELIEGYRRKNAFASFIVLLNRLERLEKQ